MASVSAPLEPPWVLRVLVVIAALPPTPAIDVTVPPTPAIDVPWPRRRVAQDQPPPAAPVIRLAAPPQGPWRMPLPPVLRYMLEAPPR